MIVVVVFGASAFASSDFGASPLTSSGLIAGAFAYAVWAYVFLLRIPPFARQLACAMSVSGEEGGPYLALLCAAETAGVLLAVAIGFYIAICRRIGAGNSFCRENANALNRIACLLLCAAAIFAAVPLFAGFGEQTLLIEVIGLMVAAVSVLAWALGKLVLHAAALKEENDLTI